MNMRPGEYSGPIDCLRTTVKHEGPMALYKGFAPTFARQAPFVVVTFLTLEQIKRFWQFLDNRDGEGVQVQQAAPL
jgi:solute carrier family 25 oxoglutarate transporter 11